MRISLAISFFLILFAGDCFAQTAVKSTDTAFIRNKINGLLIGSLIGDALGGPIEFQGQDQIQASPNPPHWWTDTADVLNDSAIKAAGERIYLREYKYVLPHVQAYGSWTENAPPGTVTDDSRNKIIFMNLLRKAIQNNKWQLTDKDLAKSFLDFPNTSAIEKHDGYDSLCREWMKESNKAINWLMGNRNLNEAAPPERFWNGYPTCYGQMVLQPMAAIYAGDPMKAYKASYQMAWFDNGFGKDMNAGLMAGLAVAMTLNADSMTNEQIWNNIIATIKTTDPYGYQQIPWCYRAVDRWLEVANLFATQAKGSPSKLFAMLDEELKYNFKWEAQVPFVFLFSLAKLCRYDPLAMLQLSIEWGWDHDTYAQLVGAFIGAIYGPQIFQRDMRELVTKRMQLDYDEDINSWTEILIKIRAKSAKKLLFKNVD